MRLNGKQVVVIGGSSGIGLETARLALLQGALATIAGRSADRLRSAAESLKASTSIDISNRLRTVGADMADESSIRSLFDGETRVDHIFVSAGELSPGAADLVRADLESLRSILDIRLVGVARVVRHATPKLNERGSITLMSGRSA